MGQATDSPAITFGLVSIPCKTYLAAKSETIGCNMLTQTKHRVKQKLVDAETGEEVERSNLLRGYEYIKGKKGAYGESIIVTDDDLDSLTKKNEDNVKVIDILEFIDHDALPALQIEKTYYLGPGDTGKKSYVLLANVLRKKNVIALATWYTRGRDHLVAIKHFNGGMIMHQLYYSDELRPFEEGDLDIEISEKEEKMAGMLVDQLYNKDYNLNNYRNVYAEKFNNMIDKKIAAAKSPPKEDDEEPETQANDDLSTTNVVDLVAILKESLKGNSA